MSHKEVVETEEEPITKETVLKTLRESLNMFPSGDYGYQAFVFPRGLQYKQYMGMVAMAKLIEKEAMIAAFPISSPGYKYIKQWCVILNELANKLMSESSACGGGTNI